MPETNPQPERHTRRWKRTAAAVMLLLVGGAVVNVAVAWGCSLASGTTRAAWVEGIAASSGTPQTTPSFLTRLHERETATTRGGSYSFGFAEFSLWDHDRTTWGVVVGWPAFTFGGSLRVSDQNTSTVQRDESGILWDLSGQVGRWIPVNPLWSGFIINTLFYALLLWLLFAAPFTARRALRRKRGQCEKCAYPIGISPVCTECGAAVARKVEA